jgi:hypothetical protein
LLIDDPVFASMVLSGFALACSGSLTKPPVLLATPDIESAARGGQCPQWVEFYRLTALHQESPIKSRSDDRFLLIGT